MKNIGTTEHECSTLSWICIISNHSSIYKKRITVPDSPYVNYYPEEKTGNLCKIYRTSRKMQIPQ